MPEEHTPWWDRLVGAPDEHDDTEEQPIEEPIRRRTPRPEAEAPALDTSDLDTDDPDDWTYGRPEPAWVIKGDRHEEDLGTIKSGKEGTVSLQRWTKGTHTHLVAVKRYRPRDQRAFRREDAYRDGYSYKDARITRAMQKRTRFGRALLEYEWAYREYPMMRLAWDAGCNVPYPIEPTTAGLAMEYLGDSDGPAPRLVDVRLDPDTAREAFDMVVKDIKRLMDRYLVHGDLSAYNILWWRDRTWIIDFPQAMDVAKATMGLTALRRDVANICRHFRRWGVDTDPVDLFEEVMQDSPVAWA